LEQLVMKAQAGSGGEAAFAEICRRFTGLVTKYANRPHLAGIRDEAAAEGWLAVAAAVRTYDQAMGVRFAGYVESRVKYAVWNLFKRERRRWQQETSLDAGGSGDDDNETPNLMAALAAAGDVAGEVDAKFTAGAVRQAVALLPDKQRLAVRTLLDEARLNDVAAELGVSPQAVYNLRRRGLARLKKELAGMYESVRG